MNLQKQPGAGSNYQVSFFTQRYLEHFGDGDLVSLGTDYQPVLIYSDENSSLIKYTFFDQNFAEKNGSIDPQTNQFAVQELNCKGLFEKKMILCLISRSATSLLSLNISLEGNSFETLELKVASSNILRMFGSYQPVSLDYWFDKTIVKVRAYDAQGNTTDEKMLLYSTTESLSSEFVVSGLSASSYIPSV